MKYLTTITEVYRVENENDVDIAIEEAKNDTRFELVKYNCAHKEQKVKGEVIADWYLLTLVKKFNNEKEPDTEIVVDYQYPEE